MLANYTEANYENSVIELFRNDLGYEYVYGPDIERDFYNPLYEEVILDSVYRLNRDLPDDAIQDALFKLKNFENGELVQKNAAFMDYLQNGIPVRYFVAGEERSSIVYLVDYKNPDNNSFIIANQWTFIENSNKRPDVILFLNGLPVVLVELKSPSREETDASEAYRQLRNYMQEIPSMFIYNAICVMSDQLTSKAGTITSGEDRFMEWKTKDGDYENTQFAQFDTFFEGMFKKERLLDIIKNFICFSNEGINSFKILAGYHQYFAVRKAIESTKHATVTDGKGGVFWHTQGSGKSLSMVFYAHLLQEALDSPTIVKSLVKAIPEDGTFTFFGDVAQQIYGSRLSWREAGLKIVKNKIWYFDRNYRNSKEIAKFAVAISKSKYFEDKQDLVEPVLPTASSPLPAIVKCKDEETELEWIVETAIRMFGNQSIAILVRNRELVDLVEEKLRTKKIIPQILKNRMGVLDLNAKISIGTFHSAKGLEFDMVFLPFCSVKYLPSEERILANEGRDEALKEEAKLLYVAITRAKRGLILSYTAEKTELLLEVDESLYDERELK